MKSQSIYRAYLEKTLTKSTQQDDWDFNLFIEKMHKYDHKMTFDNDLGKIVFLQEQFLIISELLTLEGPDRDNFSPDEYWQQVINLMDINNIMLSRLVKAYVDIIESCIEKEYNIYLRSQQCNYNAYATTWDKHGKFAGYDNVNDTYKANPKANYEEDMIDLQNELKKKKELFNQLPKQFQIKGILKKPQLIKDEKINGKSCIKKL